MTHVLNDLDELPSYLSAPSRSLFSPPVQTRVQELPFGELAWEDFEKLCMRLAQLEADVVYCQLYGVKGQRQEGIDLFAATKTGPKYRVYQCKREKEFDAGKIKGAVGKFLSGKWVDKTEYFVLCTKESLVERTRADEVVAQRAVLAARGIAFHPWDSDQLNLKLKDQPRLIDDFFGRTWVEAFCGREVAEQLGGRLDATQVMEFRQRLGSFYAKVFEKHDPGLPAAETITAPCLPLRDRYVVPDVIEARASSVLVKPAEEELTLGTGNGASDPPRSAEQRPITYEERQVVSEWLASGNNLLVLAPAGGGKSSLVRFVALDSLDDCPRLADIARQWGNHLPVWISFPQWTKLIEAEGTEPCSLKRLLQLWLRGWDEERLWPLVDRALDDDRLLLLVDGLDEWASVGAARIAMERLRVFIEQRKVPSLAVSRPQGFQQLGIRPAGWRIARLADFSREQQRQLALTWFRYREIQRVSAPHPASNPEAERRATAEANRLIEELDRSSGLAALAQTPLLLTLLIYHRMHNVRLPQTRCRAYESLVEHLISVHPERRRVAANDAGEPGELSGDDIRYALAALACHIQSAGGEGRIEIDAAVREVEVFLRDGEHGLGLDALGARKLSRQLLDVGESHLGLLVRYSPTAVGFLHRTFQEYLAAVHLSRLPLQVQLQTVESHFGDPRWRETILALLHCNNRAHEVETLVQRVRSKGAAAQPLERQASESLLAEAAFGDFNCPARLAQDLAATAFTAIETGARMAHRERLLRHALGGLAFAKVRDLVRAKLRSWFPCWSRYRSNIFDAMAAWPAEPDVVECLWKGMHDQESSSQYAAGLTLAQIGRGQQHIGRRVITLALSAEEPNTRAVAVDALVRGWQTLDGVQPVLEASGHSVASEVRLAGIRGKLSLGSHTQADRDELLRLGRVQTHLHHSWREQIPQLLLQAWRGDETVKRTCLESLVAPRHEREALDPDVAWPTLLIGFPADMDVADLIRAGLEQKNLFLGVLWSPRCWQMLGAHAKDNRMLADALDRWLKEEKPTHPGFFQAATASRSAIAKARLLDELQSPLPQWAAVALLEGWGLEDHDVATKFDQLLSGPPSSMHELVHLLPRLDRDAKSCRQRLLALVGDPNCRRPDLAIVGLSQLGGERPDRELLDIVFAGALDRPNVFWMDRNHLVDRLIATHHADPRVRDLAMKQFSYDFPEYATIARAYSDDREIRTMLIERLTPLPDHLRLVIAERLPHESPDTAFSRDLLGLYDREQDEQVKCQASLSFWSLVKAAAPVSANELERLRNNIVRYGPDLEEQRQAAFCGLATLGRLDIMATAKETIGEERICAISTFTKLGQRNGPLLKCILEHWESIKQTFGEQTNGRLNGRRGDWQQMWELLAPFADAYPPARRELARLLSERPEASLGQDTLLFLGRTMPRSRLLLDHCLKTLRIGDDGADVGGPMALVAAELLGRNFHDDPEVLKTILAGRGGELFYQKTILCLCEGWENSESMDRAYQMVLHDHWRELSRTIWHRVLCRRGNTEAVFKEIVSLVNSVGGPRRLAGSLVVRPFVLRIGGDERLVGLLHHRLQKNPTPSEKASLPRLLGMGRGVGDAVRTWCLAELSLSAERHPELGFDWIAGRVRAVSECLLDVLEPEVPDEDSLAD